MARTKQVRPCLLLVAGSVWCGACSTGIKHLDDRVDRVLLATSGYAGLDIASPAVPSVAHVQRALDEGVYVPPTVNPPAAEIRFVPSDDQGMESVISRLEMYTSDTDGGRILDLEGALAYALRHSREYTYAEEEYVLAAISLLVERHLWGPRFFNTITATTDVDGDGALYDASLSVINDLVITHRLPWGGEVSAQAVASATEDLHYMVSGEEGIQSADLLLSADIPLLRGSGTSAIESRVQAERTMIYAARTFELFRRQFLVSIAADYLDLVVAQRNIENAEMSVESFEFLRQEQLARSQAGLIRSYLYAEAENDLLDAKDNLSRVEESYRLKLDRFKIRLGMSLDDQLTCTPDQLGLPMPKIEMHEAVRIAMTYRLDLQNQRDQLDDAYRALTIARGSLRGDLDLSASLGIPTDDSKDRAGLNFEPEDLDFSASITYGFPLDREQEHLNLRRAQITANRAERDFQKYLDEVTLDTRASVRAIDAARFSVDIQDRNVAVARIRAEAIQADDSSVSQRERSESIEQTLRANDSLEAARRDLDISILDYLLKTGQLRVDRDGTIEKPPGMRTMSDDRNVR